MFVLAVLQDHQTEPTALPRFLSLAMGKRSGHDAPVRQKLPVDSESSAKRAQNGLPMAGWPDEAVPYRAKLSCAKVRVLQPGRCHGMPGGPGRSAMNII